VDKIKVTRAVDVQDIGQYSEASNAHWLLVQNKVLGYLYEDQ
jgi:hypothetical protein